MNTFLKKEMLQLWLFLKCHLHIYASVHTGTQWPAFGSFPLSQIYVCRLCAWVYGMVYVHMSSMHKHLYICMYVACVYIVLGVYMWCVCMRQRGHNDSTIWAPLASLWLLLWRIVEGQESEELPCAMVTHTLLFVFLLLLSGLWVNCSPCISSLVFPLAPLCVFPPPFHKQWIVVRQTVYIIFKENKYPRKRSKQG
jgi:hypothetical protein